MLKLKQGVSLLMVILISFISLGQTDLENLNPPASEFPYWIEMMQDQNANFYDVQKAFNMYWEGREITKGSGWKPFKRWEWWQERHINPDGTRHAPDKVFNEYKKYLEKHPNAEKTEGNWENLGPFNLPSGDKGYKGLGRINAIAFHPTDENIVYIGAPAGGLWQYDNSKGNWSSTTDDLPTLGVSSIVVDWSNPDNIYMGTGDRDAGDAQGMGVFISTDGGETWEQWSNGMGNKTVGRMIQHPMDSEIIYAATSGGIYKTIDAGENWALVFNGSHKDIVFKPNDPSVLYAAGNGNFYKSSDDGENWQQITNGIPSGSRSVIAVTAADPDYVYCLLSNGDSYKGTWLSMDEGESFTEMSNSPNIMSWGCEGGSGGQAWYDLDIAADPNDKNTIYAGGVNCFKSTDAGETWEISSHWWGDCSVPSVHADLHVLEYNPLNDRLYAGNDGGIYYTTNGGSSWPEITSGLPISQVYRIGQSRTVKDKVVNGYQDNGSSTYLGNNIWQATGGGDGMECAVDHTNPAYTYHTVYYGAIYRKYNMGSEHQVGGNGAHGMNEEGGWVTPFCLHEGNSDIMFSGMKNVWRAEGVTTNSFTWKKITENGGGNINVVEHSPADHDLFYYARNGQLYRSDNVMAENPEWITLSSYIPGSGNIFDVECCTEREDVVYVARGSKVYFSEDRGFNWTDISGSLPDINMNSLAYYCNSIGGIYVASDAGVYYRDDFKDDWVMFSNGLPVDASINEIEIYHNPIDPSEDVIRAGTYGRGMWSSPMWQSEPLCNFEVEETTMPVGCDVNFYDLSEGVPTQWEWTFEGGSPGSSNAKNPQGIVYLEEGIYDVSLTVTNAEGTDTKTLEDYITVSETAVPDVNFTVSDSISCSGQVIEFYDLSSNCPVGWVWEFTPSSITYLEGTNENSQNPVVSFNETANYTVGLTVLNNAGSNELIKEDYIYIGGIDLPFYDDFEDGNLNAKSWTTENPDFDVTWAVAEVGGNGGSKAAYMNFFDYIVPPGERDQLISPVLSFNDYDEVYLSFEYAYARRHTSVTDSLIVKISDNCGESWTRLFEGGDDGSGNFATHELMTELFIPAVSEDWCGAGYGPECVQLDISEYANMGNMQIMFESYNYFGNNLYLDNILIGPLTSLTENTATDNINIFPNPSNGKINIVLPENSTNTEIRIFDLQGSEILKLNTSNDQQVISTDLNDFGMGVYFIKLTNANISVTKKVILQ
jgi:PKD repeat protein